MIIKEIKDTIKRGLLLNLYLTGKIEILELLKRL